MLTTIHKKISFWRWLKWRFEGGNINTVTVSWRCDECNKGLSPCRLEIVGTDNIPRVCVYSNRRVRWKCTWRKEW